MHKKPYNITTYKLKNCVGVDAEKTRNDFITDLLSIAARDKLNENNKVLRFQTYVRSSIYSSGTNTKVLQAHKEFPPEEDKHKVAIYLALNLTLEEVIIPRLSEFGAQSLVCYFFVFRRIELDTDSCCDKQMRACEVGLM